VSGRVASTRAPTTLWWIVGLKLLKAIALVALGIGLLVARRLPAEEVLTHVAAALHVPATSRVLMRAMSFATTLTPGREAALGLTALAYAGLFVVEGVGLARRAPWARWLTIGATSCLVPLEVYEIARRPTGVRIAALLLNVAVVAYLVWRKDVFEGH
jgi:uncharacterized membrane protein (DUF2068 family)